jgi:ribosomal protein S18 acetylase RimI-like enzyme
MILQIEELSLNAWPAPQTLLYDGWVLRFAGGYTRRANSINPLYASALPLEEKIAACEQLYRAQRLPVTFKMTPGSQPAHLDEVLAERGYQADAHTSVQLLDLKTWSGESPKNFNTTSALNEEWFAAFCKLSGTPEKHFAPMRQILSLLLPTHCFAMLQVENQPVACGLAVLENGFVGMFDIVVAADQRRKGFGRIMMDGLLAWGKKQGADTSYLQVMCNNPPALRLYANLGYREIYRYWYRVSS